LAMEDFIYTAGVRKAIQKGQEFLAALCIRANIHASITLALKGLSPEEREIILAGSLMNHYSR
jgi:aconitate hydratase